MRRQNKKGTILWPDPFPRLYVEFHLLVAMAEGGSLSNSVTLPGARQVSLRTCPDSRRLLQVTGDAPHPRSVSSGDGIQLGSGSSGNAADQLVGRVSVGSGCRPGSNATGYESADIKALPNDCSYLGRHPVAVLEGNLTPHR